MQHSYKKLFNTITPFIATPELHSRIAMRIKKLERRAIYTQRMLFGALVAFTISGLTPAIYFLVHEFSQSSFISYLSLMLTDSDVALIHSKEFVFSLIESLPLTALTLVSSILLISLIMLRLLLTRRLPTHAYTLTKFA